MADLLLLFGISFIPLLLLGIGLCIVSRAKLIDEIKSIDEYQRLHFEREPLDPQQAKFYTSYQVGYKLVIASIVGEAFCWVVFILFY